MRKRFYAVLAVNLIVAVLLTGTVAGQASWLEIRDKLHLFERMLVEGAAEFNSTAQFDGATTFNAAVTLADENDLTVGDNLSVTDDLTVGEWIGATKQATVTVTSGGTLVPTGSYQPISAAGTVGFGAIDGCPVSGAGSGRLLHVVNGANQTITITETGNLVMAGSAALGIRDNITYLCQGTLWTEQARVNN